MKLRIGRALAHAFALSAILAGCTIGNGHICGPQTPLAYCDREAYQKLMYPTPLSDYWQKEAMTAESRRQDWIRCGGTAKGGYGVPTNELRDKEVLAAASQKFDDMQYCMMKNGYRYTGTCEGQIPSQYPACKARGNSK